MKIKRILLLLVVLAALAFATGCGDPKDGNTSGSAESNGVISDQRNESVNSTANSAGNTDLSNEPSESSDMIGDDLSDLVSDAGDAVSDTISDVEEGVSDLFGDDGSDTKG